MVPNPVITSVTWPSSPHAEGAQCKTDITYRNDGTDGEVFSRVVDAGGVVLASFISSVSAGEVSTDSVYFYMPPSDITIYVQVGVGSTVTDQKGPKTILVTEPSPTPQVTTVTVTAPLQAYKDMNFTINGIVKDQYEAVMSGVPVNLYDNGTYIGTITTNTFGAYSKIHSTGLPGTHELAANADSRWAYTNINIIEPPIEPPSCDPWPWYSDPEGPFDGATPVWIEEYRTWNIWDLTEVEPGAHTYGASDPRCIGQSGFTSTLNGIRILIDGWIGPAMPTTITIEAPATVAPEEPFSCYGTLYETDTGTPIPNETVSLSYNGYIIGEAITGINGEYMIQASISTEGTYTITSAFAGTLILGASEAIRRVSTGVTPPIQALIAILGSAIAGIALIRYSLSRN